MTVVERSADHLTKPEFEEQVLFGLLVSQRIRDSVMPLYGIKEYSSLQSTILDDFVYRLDSAAEEAIGISFSEVWESGKLYGYVTEDQGLVLPPGGEAEYIFLIDPVDGSRIAQIGAEMSCVTMVGVKGTSFGTFEDIEFGITQPIKENQIFVGVKGNGVYEIENGQTKKVEPFNSPEHLDRSISAVYQPYGISLEYQGRILDPLLKEIGFTLTYPCDSYYALSLIRGQNEVHLNLIKRILADYPELPISYGYAKPLYPMDIAAAWLMIQELAGKITDANGNPLDTNFLWQFNEDSSWSANNQISWVAATNPKLHEEVLMKLQEGFNRLK